MDVAVIKNIVSASGLVRRVAFRPDRIEVLYQIVDFRNKLLIAVPGFEHFLENSQSVLIDAFDKNWLRVDRIIEATEVIVVLQGEI